MNKQGGGNYGVRVIGGDAPAPGKLYDFSTSFKTDWSGPPRATPLPVALAKEAGDWLRHAKEPVG